MSPISLLLLVAIPSALTQSRRKEPTEDYSEFLFENAKLCGDPFSDPIWIPVLDVCSIECDPQTGYCVENEELVQKCTPYPEECQKLITQRHNTLMSLDEKHKVFGTQNRIQSRTRVGRDDVIMGEREREVRLQKSAIEHLTIDEPRPSRLPLSTPSPYPTLITRSAEFRRFTDFHRN